MFTRRKLGVPCIKIVSTVPKIWRAVPIFLTHVNGVLVPSTNLYKRDLDFATCQC